MGPSRHATCCLRDVESHGSREGRNPFLTEPHDLRTVAYGYGHGEVPLPPLPAVKEDLKIIITDLETDDKRPAEQISLYMHVDGAAQPHPNTRDSALMRDGVKKRFGFAGPPVNRKVLRQLRKFVRLWLKKNLVPLAPDTFRS